MKNILFAVCFLFAGTWPCLAEDFAKMSLDVPAGWIVMDQGDTLTVYSNDMSATVTITCSDASGSSAGDYADQAARSGGLGSPQPAAGGFLLQNTAAPEAWVYITVINSKLLVANMMGDRATLLTVVGSAKPK